MDKIRTFVAVRLPAEIRRRLMLVEKRLMQSGADVKWVPEENFHITLKFLGDVEQNRLSAVKDAVGRAVEGASAFDLSLAGVGAFGRPLRVVWVGIASGKDELKSLAKRVEDELAGIGFPAEDRPFSAHITLGRVRSPRGIEKLSACIESLNDEPVGDVHVDGASVMKSELRREGPAYTPIADLGFRISD